MAPDELDRLDALHAVMTPDEWELHGESIVDVAGRYLDVVDSDDARGIVALHNDFPAPSAGLRRRSTNQQTRSTVDYS